MLTNIEEKSNICNSMDNEWQEYYRIAARSHILEAKRAKGGEKIGDRLSPNIAKNGEWICRNPVNGYTWPMNDQDFSRLYRSCNYKFERKKKKPKEPKREKTSASNEATKNDNPEAGPLFD